MQHQITSHRYTNKSLYSSSSCWVLHITYKVNKALTQKVLIVFVAIRTLPHLLHVPQVLKGLLSLTNNNKKKTIHFNCSVTKLCSVNTLISLYSKYIVLLQLFSNINSFNVLLYFVTFTSTKRQRRQQSQKAHTDLLDTKMS